LPGGEILGYLARLPNPTPYGNFTPGPVLLFGEQRMLEALRSRPPDWVALVHRDTAVFGARYFGTDYGLELAAWIDENYQPVREIGAPPFHPRGQMGARILRKNASAESRR
ncbi:MAG: hypothetical protein O7A09_01125, partial [Proteobacteria bacterium]|nr:hypothetical protein [Pseudomonadota bacterium]